MKTPTPLLVKTAQGWVEMPKGFTETKNIKAENAELKDIDFKNKIVSCYWSKFGNKDFDEDVMIAGCYSKTITERGPQGTNEIFYLKSHNWELPLGKPTELKEDSIGLYAEIPCTTGTTFSEDTLKLMDAGLMVQNSVGFQTKRYEMVQPDANDWSTWYRNILEVKLYEGSCVVLGANDQTPFLGFKSMNQQELNTLKSRIIKTLRSGNMHDDTYSRLEIALNQLYSEAYLLGQKSLQKDQTPELENSTSETETPASFYGSFANTKQEAKSIYTFNF
jgi:HK97 family phage prohead protease